MAVPSVVLNNEVAIPQLGFGVWQVPAGDTAKVVRTAIEAGYRSIDTAASYRNEAGVGEAIRSAGVPRDELFVTTKLPNPGHGYDEALRAFDTSLAELGPRLQQKALREFHAEHGIVTEAWSPLAQGSLLSDATLTALAAKYDKSPAQLVLRWHLQLGTVVIPKSVTPSRIGENFDVFDFELAEDDLAALAEFDDGIRTGPDPDTFDLV